MSNEILPLEPSANFLTLINASDNWFLSHIEQYLSVEDLQTFKYIGSKHTYKVLTVRNK